MTQLRSARNVTFYYFSIMAVAILTSHYILLESTIDKLEVLNAQNTLENESKIITQKLKHIPSKKVYTEDNIQAYVGLDAIPQNFSIQDDIPFYKAIEVYQTNGYATDFFVMKSPLTYANGKTEDLYLFYFDRIYELSEDQIFENHRKQAITASLLLILILIVVMLISRRLTHPLSVLAKQLQKRSATDLSPIDIPNGVKTMELHMLVESLNQYQDRINRSIERERSFNRYASHELRSPLMVIKGATSLLGQSTEPKFIAKQRKRLSHACDEMNDFVTTLLYLTREESPSEQQMRELTKEELEEIVQSHTHLIAYKPVECQIELTQPIHVKIPKTSLKILVGNLLKNAFACTEKGSVVISVTPSRISIIDTGIGLGKKPRGIEGYGLGLLISRDICHKYGYKFDLLINQYYGCTAKITLQPQK
ncbi:two-component sensor histidine kinase [Photobacterium leiognathi subsp. mandapamensis]|nr:two-component sensor histidine kinase [Photobacterium leiognathi subsp. mandapamensis]